MKHGCDLQGEGLQKRDEGLRFVGEEPQGRRREAGGRASEVWAEGN